ncbi:hypothetical protein B5E91_09000 [Thomasclavelia spiroformis]|uniref:Glycosyltransferase 2-like domain-containing protein n=1 Tax=Thomasclavelia spiroformis TaxID=29348 RepID=A0A1Y4QHV6_9FIRM|nr:glycosyltransferase [Thomasclavelia spiroformis]OUQ04807.1 hypothetical protein B5E91_09000 [Thomasclavelia spiroformis]
MRLSIIVPMFNSEKYISKCIESIINQKFIDFELILVNDGSEDRTLEICEMYKKNDNRIKIINKENGGVSSARNIGIKYAKGDYIGFVDSDDYIDELMYEKLISIANNKEVDIVICKRVIPTTKRNYGHSYPVDKIFFFSDKNQRWKKDFYEGNLETFVTNKIFKSKVIKDKIVFKKYPIYEDRIFLEELYFNNPSMYFIDDNLYYYRHVYDGSLSRYHINRFDIIVNAFYNDLRLNKKYDQNIFYTDILISFTNSLYSCILQEGQNSFNDRKIIFEQINNSIEFQTVYNNLSFMNIAKKRVKILKLLYKKKYKILSIYLVKENIFTSLKKIIRGNYEKYWDKQNL